MKLRLESILFFLLYAVGITDASRGDQLSIFRACVSDHIANHCAPNLVDQKDGESLPLHLRLTRWNCASNADYLCQRAVTHHLEEQGQRIEQFHGKWPFIRILGVQEPASVIFSILNGYVHLRGLELVKRRVSIKNPMRNYYIVFAYVGMNAWLWSTIFHIRDFASTEKLDYFSAGTYVLYGLFYAPVRVFKLYSLKDYSLVVKIWGTTCMTALSLHMAYLTFITFDYGYNMIANVVVGSLHALVWLLYSIKYHKGRPFWAWWPALTVLALSGAMCFELFDFSPWFYTIDAHSLWHASTIPITWFWYKFLLRDAAWEDGTSAKSLKRHH